MNCPDDETLLALVQGELDGGSLVALDSHLDGCELCREVVGALGSGPRLARRRLERGDALGRFLVLERIGEGAMGAVYSAYDPELDRRIAVKLLHAGRSDTRSRARLVREAQAMARLSHAHVVTVFDVGLRGDDVYVAMELVDGDSLRGWLATSRRPQSILHIFRQAGEGLAAAHAAGLVHRDFKPENVFVTRSGSAKVGDFGLATGDEPAAVGAPDGALLAASITRSGALLGTPAYMAPEQLAGEAADARADQFAFCVALYEALTGRRPFVGETLGELAEAIQAGPPPAKLPAGTARALRRGLSARREHRFDHMSDLLRALQPRPRARLPWMLAGVAGVAGLALAAWPSAAEPACAASAETITTVWNSSAREGLDRSSIAALSAWTERWTEGRVDACEATQVRHEQSPAQLDRRMACLDQQRDALEVVLHELHRDGSAAVAIDVIETLPEPVRCRGVSHVTLPPPAVREAVAEISHRLAEGRVTLATGAYEATRAAAEPLLTAAEQTDYAPVLVRAHLLYAAALRALARASEADTAAETALLLADAARDDRGAAEAWLERVRGAGSNGQYALAATHARHASAAITRAGGPDDLRTEHLRLRGVLRTNLDELAAAETDLRETLRVLAARLGPRDARLASVHSSLGDALRLQERLPEALAEHERALAIDRAAFSEDHPRVARDLHNTAGILRRLDRRDEALERYERALDIKRAVFGDEHPEVALTRNSLGLMARDRGDLEGARAQWEAAAQIFEAHGHGDAALTRFNLALIDLESERWQQAQDNIQRAIRIDSARVGPNTRHAGGEEYVLARASLGLGRRAEARAAARRALEIGRSVGDDTLVERAQALLADAAEEVRLPRPRARAASARRAANPAPVATAPPPPERSPQGSAPSRDPTPPASYGAGQAWE